MNSVIIEGFITEISDCGYFLIKNIHEKLVSKEGYCSFDETIVKCLLEGILLEKASMLKTGSKVRLVGRLANSDNELVLFVEHIERRYTTVKSGKYTFKKL